MLIFSLFPIEQSVARICALSGAAVCFLIALLLGRIYEDSHWIVLNRTTFSQQKVYITEGDGPMRFVNPVSGVTQRLRLASGYEPQPLQEPGAVVAPGQILHVPFSRAGDYEVISVENPTMVLHINVSERPPWHEPGF